MSTTRLQFLVVEDNVELRGLIIQVLRLQYPGCHVEATGKITQAWNLLVHPPKRFDLVITDGSLEDGDGPDLVSVCGRRQLDPPFLGISGDPEMVERLAGAGCQAVFAKPFDLNQFLSAVDRLCFPKPDDQERAHVAQSARELAAAGQHGGAVLAGAPRD